MLRFLWIITICLSVLSLPVRIARDVFAGASGSNNQRTLVKDSAGILYCAYAGAEGGTYQVFIARSTDDGASWESRWATITTGPLENRDPTMVIDSSDTLHLIWRGNTVTGPDSDLLYTQYPSPSIEIVSEYIGYPGAEQYSLAIDTADNLHAVWTGAPSLWRVRYARFDRASRTWGPAEIIEPLGDSHFPSIEIDGSGNPHVVHRRLYSGVYSQIHRYKTGGIWRGYNGENCDTLNEFVTSTSTVEYSSMFIDNSDNLYAVWMWERAFVTQPDTLRFRKYNSIAHAWEPVHWLWGNSITDARARHTGDVVADELGNVYVLYHDSENVRCAISDDFGTSFLRDTLLQDDTRALYPNARGSNYPAFNRPRGECIDYVWTWSDPDSTVNSLMFDRMCLALEEIDSTHVCASLGEPLEGAYTSCSDQSITTYIECCGGDTIVLASDTNTVEYFDSSSMTWETPVYPAASVWESFRHIDAEWIWFEYPATSYESRWFRSFMTACDEIDSAFIHVQCDNKAYIYANGTYIDTTHGNSGGGYAGWRTMYEFDLTPYLHGGVDTIEITGANASGYAGLIFEITTICRSNCCGEMDESSIIYSVNGTEYTTADPELIWDGDRTLTFVPVAPDTFENGDTVTACIEYAADTCTGIWDTPICREFYVDLAPPVIWDIEPPPGIAGDTTWPTFTWKVRDSLSGLDMSSLYLLVDSAFATPSIIWEDSLWRVEWSPLTPLEIGDSIELCFSVSDTTDYCDDNVLDTCWIYRVPGCKELEAWIECPMPCASFTSCEDQHMIFGISDTAGIGIDTTAMYFTVIRSYYGGADTSHISPPSPNIFIDLDTDTLIYITGDWMDGDSVTITLDSLFSEDGCRTMP